jgi:hypothetical protein
MPFEYVGRQNCKFCFACGNHTGCKTANKNGGVCSTCGAKLGEKPAEAEEIRPTEIELTMTVREHGYKQCNNCKKFTRGMRSQECIHCENLFPKKDAVKAAEIEEGEIPDEKFVEVARYPEIYKYPEGQNVRRVYIPAGPCPIKIKQADKESFPTDDAIKVWAHEVRQVLIDNHQFVGNDGLYYWAIQQVNGDQRYRYNSDEMKYLRMLINDLPDISIRRIPA